MTIRYKTRDLSYAVEYMRIHLRDKYFVSAYKRNGEYIIQISGLEEVKDEAEQTEPNSSEKPNNCEHITEDGVTCAKYPACDDCPDNPLNKVKGSERLVKGSEEPNNCDECKWWFGYCHLEKCEFEPIDEPKSYTTWANTEPKQGTDCTQVDWKDQMWTEAVEDEPQTDCAWK